MNYTSLESRLLFVNSPAAATSVTENTNSVQAPQQATNDGGDTPNQNVAAIRQQTPPMVETADMPPEYTSNNAANDNSPSPFLYRINKYGGVSNLLFEKNSHGKKLAAEVGMSLAFAPYGVYNAIRWGLGSLGVIGTSSPVKNISKGIWQRIKNVSSTAWDYTSKTAQTAWKTPQALVHGAVQATLGTVLSPVGAIGKFATGAVDVVRRATFGNINKIAHLIADPNNPWYGLSALPQFTNWIDKGVKNTIGKGNTASNWMYTVGKAELGIAARDIGTVVGNAKRQVADTIATPLAKMPMGLIRGKEGFARSNTAIDGVVDTVRTGSLFSGIWNMLSPKANPERFEVPQS